MAKKFDKTQRLSRAEKNANDKEYYRHKMDELDTRSSSIRYNGVSEYTRRKVNYDLYNNIIDHSDFAHVCAPYGAEVGELPTKMVNRDISSPRIKAIEGMESKRPFPWKPVAVNPEATTRKEEEEYSLIREYVVAEIIKPIKAEIEAKYAEQTRGQKLTHEEKQKIQEQIAQELDAKTPDRVKKYMQRKHQDPAEVMSQQILNYLMHEQRIKGKFSKGWKHANLSAYEVYFVGIENDKPIMRVANSARFEYERSPDNDFIEDSNWATYEMRMTPGEIAAIWGDEIGEAKIDELFEDYEHYAEKGYLDRVFDFSQPDTDRFDDDDKFVRVLHCNWKGLRKIGWLTYIDKHGDTQLDYVDEEYKLDPENGDIDIEWEWVEEAYQGYKIGKDIYAQMEPVPGQFKDLNTLHECKLSYYGVSYDDLNSVPTCPMDRMKPYQYYYNIVMYRLENLLASDKGKKVLMNLDAIPDESGIDIKKWQYFFESTPFMWFNTDEEGSKYQDANSIAKVIDMSLVSDISKYIDIAEYLEKKCGKAVGIPDEAIGDIAPSAEVGNTRQQMASVSNILEPMFQLHTQVKKNVLQALIEAAKVAYVEKDPGILSYILDDMSLQQFTIDKDLLDNSTIGIFVTDTTKAEEAKQMIQQLAHAAMQNDKAKLSDVITIIREDNLQEAEEILKVAEQKAEERDARAAEMQRKSEQEKMAREAEEAKLEREHDLDKIRLEEGLKTARELKKQAMLSVGFNENKDMDGDGKLDVLEIARDGIDADIRAKEHRLERDKFQHQKKVDDKELKIKEKQANKPKNK